MNQKIQKMVVIAMFLALATVLSLLKLFELPLGGSVTIVSMLPIAMISIGYGLKYGFICSFLFSVIQLALSFAEVLSWGLTPTVLVASMILDYIIAYTIIGLAGLFRNKGVVGMCGGIALALTLRFVCHLISGTVLFASWMPEGFTSPFIYSIIYNGTFMLPEMVFTMIGAALLFKAPAVNKMMRTDMQSA